MIDNRSTGFWVLIILGIAILIILLLGQTMSFINYRFTVEMGLQESADLIGEMGVAMNKGFGVGDTIIYAPILLIGICGLLLRQRWGRLVMAGALAITAYWPIVILFILLFAKGTPGFHFTNYSTYFIVLTGISIYGIWGLIFLIRSEKTVNS